MYVLRQLHAGVLQCDGAVARNREEDYFRMSKASQLALLSTVGLVSAGLQRERPTQISSHKIEQKKEEIQLSKRQLQKLKGKKARKNRGKNRR